MPLLAAEPRCCSRDGGRETPPSCFGGRDGTGILCTCLMFTNKCPLLAMLPLGSAGKATA